MPQSRARREAKRAADEAKAPTEHGRGRSALAEFLRDPTGHKERELIRAAANGELTAHDMQAALAAQIIGARKLLPGRGRAKTKPDEVKADNERREVDRQVHVLLKQLIEGLKGVVMETPGGGPMLLVELHWPELYAGGDRGEDVRLRAPATPPKDEAP